MFRTLGNNRSYSEYRKSYYDQILESKVSPSFFINLMSRYGSDASSYTTKQIFKAKGNIDFGSSKESVIKSWGRPSYSAYSQHVYKHQVLLYRTMIGGLKAKYELHFLNDKLFSFSLKFSYLSIEQQETLMNAAGYKYLQHKKPVPKDSFKIFDAKANMLYVELNTDVVFHYMSGNQHQQELVELALDVKSAQFEQKKRKREMELIHCL